MNTDGMNRTPYANHVSRPVKTLTLPRLVGRPDREDAINRADVERIQGWAARFSYIEQWIAVL